MILHKTGSDWNIVLVPQPPGAENFLYSIDVIAPDNIWASGEYNDGSQYGALFLHYNGTSWMVVNSPGGGAGIIHNSANDIWSTGSSFVHYDGSSWSMVSAPIPSEGSMGSMARISSADTWAVGRYVDGDIMKTLTMHFENPLPIQLGSFTGTVVEGGNVELTWVTISEINNYGFYVQRKRPSGQAFVEVPNSFVPGHGTTNEPHTYTFTDATPGTGVWMYRLKQVDLNGETHYSDPISVDVVTGTAEYNAPLVFELAQNSPNPFNPTTAIRFEIPQTGFVSLKVFDVLGREVATLVNEEKSPASYSVRWDATNVGSGTYFYRLECNGRHEIRKMLLMK